jgi:Putative copper export protein
VRRRGERGANAAALIGVFSPIALACAAAVIITGLGSAWLRVGSLAALWGSAYGRVLLIKLVVVSLLVVAGAYNWQRVTPSLLHEGGAGRMRRSAVAELTIGALVLAVTAVLIATRTPV